MLIVELYFHRSFNEWSLSILGGGRGEKNGHYFPFSSDVELYLRSLTGYGTATILPVGKPHTWNCFIVDHFVFESITEEEDVPPVTPCVPYLLVT